MTKKLNWYKQGQTLSLHGELDRDTFLTLWQQRQILLEDIQFLNVSDLRRVDSAGVALMLHFYHYQQQQGVTFALTGVTDRLSMLIKLYKLQSILPCMKTVGAFDL